MKLLFSFTAYLVAAAAVSVAANPLGKRGTFSQVTNFGSNPSNTSMYLYVPSTLAANPAIVVAIHYCTGSGPEYYEATPYSSLADQYGFLVIYPSSPYSGTCWDVSSTASETHNGGADSDSIASMVTYALGTYDGDASRVFVTGSSSGAMMTNVLAATYPEMFAAATVYSGVAAGCFWTGTVDGWNTTCAEGDSIHPQSVWESVALAMYPGYTGSRPRMMIFHGSADTTLYPPNFNETLKQWSGVFGYTYGDPQATYDETPSSVYTTYVYGSDLVGVYGQGVGHTVPIMGDEDMLWFGISGTWTPNGTATPTTTSSATAPTTTATSAPTGCAAAEWAQCGGIGWEGCTSCAIGLVCSEQNSYYSQCLA